MGTVGVPQVGFRLVAPVAQKVLARAEFIDLLPPTSLRATTRNDAASHRRRRECMEDLVGILLPTQRSGTGYKF